MPKRGLLDNQCLSLTCDYFVLSLPRLATSVASHFQGRPRPVLRLLMFVSIGVAVGAFFGDLSTQASTGALLGGAIGLAVMEMRKCVARRIQSASSQ